MNCNLVTKLKIQCFNSQFHCRAADLFNQHSKYVCSSFHARSRSSSWGFIFYCLSTFCCLDVFKKNHLFLSTAFKPSRQKEHHRSAVTQLSQGDAVEGSWTWWQCAHSTLLPPENPPQILSTLQRQNLLLWKQRFLPQGYPGQEGCSAVGWCWGWAESSPRPCPSVVQLFTAG